MIYLALLTTFIEFLSLEFFGYFLSPELTVYPYLYSHGLTPFRYILDQHPPLIFFGPFSLPEFLVSSPYGLFALWIILLFLINILILKYNSKDAYLRMLGVLAIWLFFSGRTFWTDTFLLFFLLGTLTLTPFLRGIFSAFIFLLKPTLIPLSIISFFRQKDKKIIYLFGFLIPISIIILFLYKQNLFQDAKYYVFDFNKSIYLDLAKKLPSPKELLVPLVLVVLLIRQIKFKDLLFSLFAAIPVFPRFEYFHLIPALTLLVIFADFKLPLKKVSLVVFTVILVMGIKKIYLNPVGNFYLNQDLLQTVEYLNKDSSQTLYVLGAGDLLYPMTKRTPPGGVYLPSLPWYLEDQKSMDKLISALASSPSTTVVVRPDATLAGVRIILNSRIYKLIESNYHQVATVGGNFIYQRL